MVIPDRRPTSAMSPRWYMGSMNEEMYAPEENLVSRQ
jgi:hypothetical protein